jgi:hypothetical protein
MQDSDENRQVFAQGFLKGLRFLYKGEECDDNAVRRAIMYMSDDKVILYRHGRGPFAAFWSSRRLPRTSLLPRAPRRFRASTVLIKRLPQLSVD